MFFSTHRFSHNYENLFLKLYLFGVLQMQANGLELSCVQTLQRVDYVFKFKMLFRNTCCKLISPYLQTKSVGGLHVNLSDWLAGVLIYLATPRVVKYKW